MQSISWRRLIPTGGGKRPKRKVDNAKNDRGYLKRIYGIHMERFWSVTNEGVEWNIASDIVAEMQCYLLYRWKEGNLNVKCCAGQESRPSELEFVHSINVIENMRNRFTSARTWCGPATGGLWATYELRMEQVAISGV